MASTDKEIWDAYCTSELARVRPILDSLGYTLDEHQPHLQGERYLMQAVTTASGRKLILLGTERDSGDRVVIKCASEPAGAHELSDEHLRRKSLEDLPFAYSAFRSPRELRFLEKDGVTISVQAFIAQETAFTDRPLAEQFALALGSFKAQERAHAATYGHLRHIARTFGSMSTQAYLAGFEGFARSIQERLPEDTVLGSLLEEARAFLAEHRETIAQYEGFLTHTDFVPHNIRVSGGDLYLLDHSSIRFGNKYEGWARFLNFMTLYEPELERAFVAYVQENRTPEESLSLRLMRLYRLGEILWYYVRTLDRSEGDLRKLNEARIAWWLHVLDAVLHGRAPSEERLAEYRALRDALRSPEEKARQKGLH